MHGGLLCIAFCLSVCLWSLDQNSRLENNSYLCKYSRVMYTPGTLQVTSRSSWAPTKAGGLTSTSSYIFDLPTVSDARFRFRKRPFFAGIGIGIKNIKIGRNRNRNQWFQSWNRNQGFHCQGFRAGIGIGVESAIFCWNRNQNQTSEKSWNRNQDMPGIVLWRSIFFWWLLTKTVQESLVWPATYVHLLHAANHYLRYLGVLHACSGGQSWQTMLSIGILFALEGHIFPYSYG